MKKFSLLFMGLMLFMSVVHAQDVKPNFEVLEFDLIARTKRSSMCSSPYFCS